MAKGEPLTGLVAPFLIITEKVCATSGALPVEGKCKSIITEYFAEGTAPTESCEVHLSVKLCDESHYKATKYCKETTTYHYKILDDGSIILIDADFELPSDFQEKNCPIHTKKSNNKKQDKNNQDSEDTFTISTLVEGGGSISGPTQATFGDTVTISFIPNDGYTISNVTIDGIAQGAISSFTFTAISSNHTVVATFVPTTENEEAPPGEDVFEDGAYNPNSHSLIARFSAKLFSWLGKH